jgi:hypothetical protein
MIVFKNNRKNKKIRVTAFCDESKDIIHKVGSQNNKYLYIGIILIETKNIKELYKKFNNLRCLANNNKHFGECKNKCKYHEINNTEIHFNKISNIKLYREWIKEFIKVNQQGKTPIRFNLLGIDTAKMNMDKFGKNKDNIYNRFFRSAVIYSFKNFYNDYDSIIIDNIFHDNGNLESHEYFKWKTIKNINLKEENIYFKNSEIKIIDSDHRKSESIIESNFIQLVDLIMGATINCIHFNSGNKNKISLTDEIYPLIQRVIKKPKNKNSRFNYYKKINISYFPNESGDLDRLH